MVTSVSVAARFDDLDKAALVELATRLQRNQSDVLRLLVRGALEVLREQEPKVTPQRSPRPRAITSRGFDSKI